MREDSLLTPESIYKRPPSFLANTNTAILTYADHAEYIRKDFSLSRPYRWACKDLYFIEDSPTVVLVTGLGIGAPGAVSACEELRFAGIRNFVSIGTAGALDRKIKADRIQLCRKAYIHEGTSPHYGMKSGDDVCIGERGSLLAERIITPGPDYSECHTWTTDGLYRETPSSIKKARARGCTTVEMEASALYSFSRFYNDISLCCFFLISDFFDGDSWSGNFYSRGILKNFTTLVSRIKSIQSAI